MSLTRWEGACKKQGSSWHLKGRMVGGCFGAKPGEHPVWCDPTDASDNEDIDLMVGVVPVNECIAIIDGFPFHRVGCS